MRLPLKSTDRSRLTGIGWIEHGLLDRAFSCFLYCDMARLGIYYKEVTYTEEGYEIFF